MGRQDVIDEPRVQNAVQRERIRELKGYFYCDQFHWPCPSGEVCPRDSHFCHKAPKPKQVKERL